MKKSIVTAISIAMMLPSVAFASTLTIQQSDAILGVLAAFGVDAQTIAAVKAILEPMPVQIAIAPQTVPIAPFIAPLPSKAVTETQATSTGSIDITSTGYYKQHLDAPHCIAPASIKSWDTISDDCQVVHLAVFVHKAGQDAADKAADLTVTTTDPAQNTVIHGTGNIQGWYEFSYLFRYSDNTVTFSADGATASVTMQAQ